VFCVAHDAERKVKQQQRREEKPRRERTGTEPLMTVVEVAELIGWSTAAVYEAVRQNRIPHRRNGRAVWFPRAAIQRWLDGADATAAAAVTS
jgi:excisionase family DNA binding protein